MPRLDDPPLRRWELNATHDRFDYARATPSEEALRIQFSLLAGINLIVAAACGIVMVAILKSPRVRRNPFNLYLLFIVIPDFIASASCFLTCIMSAPEGTYYSEAMCGWQSWYLVFGFTANCWMNAVIARELYRMLTSSQAYQHYQPPTRRQVIRQAMAVHIYAMSWAFLGTWNIVWLPHKTIVRSGFACFPMEYDFASTLFYWLVFTPAFLAIPLFYVLFVSIQLWRRQLMPPPGKRRRLVWYFARLIAVYFGMWFPMMVVCSIGSNTNLSDWIYWSGAAWSHLQGLVSAVLSATYKEDIWEACCALLCCRPERPLRGDVSLPRSSTPTRTSWLRIFGARSSSCPASLEDFNDNPSSSVSEKGVQPTEQAASSHHRSEVAQAGDDDEGGGGEKEDMVGSSGDVA